MEAIWLEFMSKMDIQITQLLSQTMSSRTSTTFGEEFGFSWFFGGIDVNVIN